MAPLTMLIGAAGWLLIFAVTLIVKRPSRRVAPDVVYVGGLRRVQQIVGGGDIVVHRALLCVS